MKRFLYTLCLLGFCINIQAMVMQKQALLDLICTVTEVREQEPLLHQSKVPLLLQALESINSEELYDTIINSLTKNWPRKQLAIQEQLLIGVAHWATQHNRTASIEKVCRGIIDKNCKHEVAEKDQESLDREIRIIKLYANINRKNALKLLSLFKKLSIDENTWNLGKYEFELLLLIYNLDSAMFEESANSLKKTHLNLLLKGFLTNAYYIEKFKNSSLSLSSIIQFGFDTLLSFDNTKETYYIPQDFFDVFATEAQDYHEEFAKQLLTVLPSLLHTYPYFYKSIASLCKSSIKKIRIAAFNEIKRFLTQSNNVLTPDVYSELLSNLAIDQIAQDYDTTPNLIYKDLYNGFKAVENEINIQILLIHLLSNPSTATSAQELLIDHLKITAPAIITSLKNIVNPVLFVSAALQVAKALPNTQLTKIIAIAQETGFTSYINKDFLLKLQEEQLYKKNTTVKNRVVFLNALLMEIFKNNGTDITALKIMLGSFSYALSHHIEPGIFKRYAQAVLRSVDADIPSYLNFAAKQELHALHAENPDLDPEPIIIATTTGRLFNVFEQYFSKSPLFLKNLHNYFKNPCITNTGFVFGFVRDPKTSTYCFHACNAETGYALWRASMHSLQPTAYAYWQNTIYLAHGNAPSISVLDINTGLNKKDVWFPYPHNIADIKITSSGIMYVMQMDLSNHTYILNCLNLNTNVLCYSVPVNSLRYNYIANDRLAILTNPNTVEIYSAECQKPQKIALPDSLWFYESLILFNNNCMLYFHNNTLKCLNLADTKLLWELKFPHPITQKPILAGNNEILYVVTEKEIAALSINIDPRKTEQIIWQNLYANLKIMLSSDENTLYGIDSASGTLYSIDCHNGTKTEIYQGYGMATKSLLKNLNNKVYICDNVLLK